MSRLSFTESINRLPKKCISSVKDVKADYKGRVTTPFPFSTFTMSVVHDDGKTIIVLEVKDNG